MSRKARKCPRPIMKITPATLFSGSDQPFKRIPFQGKSHTLKEIEIENTDPKDFGFWIISFTQFSGEILGRPAFSGCNPERLYEKYPEKAEQMLALEIAAGVAHEIRSPLTSVRGFLQLVKIINPDNPK